MIEFTAAWSYTAFGLYYLQGITTSVLGLGIMLLLFRRLKGWWRAGTKWRESAWPRFSCWAVERLDPRTRHTLYVVLFPLRCLVWPVVTFWRELTPVMRAVTCDEEEQVRILMGSDVGLV